MNALRHWIDLCEMAVPPLVETPAFQRWFSGSKVVDSAGRALVSYHGTDSRFDAFRPLSHFGTRDAAATRVAESASTIIAAYLQIANPIRVTDDYDQGDGDQTIWQALHRLVERKVVSRDDYAQLIGQWRGIDEYEHQLRALRVVSEHGFDGLVYRNKVEHKGSTSWVVFRAAQVWCVGADRPGVVAA